MEQRNTATQRINILKTYGHIERFCSEKERFDITGVSRTLAYELEQIGEFPKRVSISKRKVAWFLSDLFLWMEARAIESGVNYDR